MLKADIKNGVDAYAVKFKQIEIRLKAIDSVQQDDMDSALENCEVTLICGTDHYYRYREKLYLIPLDNELEIRYTINNGGQWIGMLSLDTFVKTMTTFLVRTIHGASN